MHSIKYSNLAVHDLDEAIVYIAKESIANARKYLFNYEKKIKLLQLNPHMGLECKTRLINKNCRVLVYESHIIIYKIDSDKNEILIIRIYHGSVDYINKINKGI